MSAIKQLEPKKEFVNIFLFIIHNSLYFKNKVKSRDMLDNSMPLQNLNGSTYISFYNAWKKQQHLSSIFFGLKQIVPSSGLLL